MTSFSHKAYGVSPAATGFTLVEMLITVVVIGITAGSGIVLLRGVVSSSRLRHASLELVGYLDSSRRNAMRLGGTCTINRAGTTFSPSNANGNTCAGDPALDLSAAASDPNLAVDNTSPAAVIFTQRGTSVNGATFVLTLAGASTDRCVRVTSPLGIVGAGSKPLGTAVANCNYINP
ncbi:GspH/FimT family pseudopilin [Synechococcus sp. CBW1107]|uniref:GspH/FimT family pseudopilin n=1 Tax=Synechococcus sp. CBW1107 TaxID=2789857 RepID=UPI0018CF5A21|nr:GspH/FimT family pseudopilin [Synechococcus sp. CBW1107]QPN58311.1 GspH/FimT family pseudopilin [Synechococcus sp. CBW1107]